MIKMDTSNYFGGTNNSTTNIPTSAASSSSAGGYYNEDYPVDIKYDPNDSDEMYANFLTPDDLRYATPQTLPPPVPPSPLAPGHPPITFDAPIEPIFRQPTSSHYYDYGAHHAPQSASNQSYPPGLTQQYPPNMWYQQQYHHLHPQYQQPHPLYASHGHGQGHHHHHRHHHDSMSDMMHFSNSSGREARNRAEKNRRDKLNGSIHQLSTMVPHVAESPRRMDKTAVLRLTAHGLRVHYVFGDTITKATEENDSWLMADSLMRLLDGFLISMTCKGQIVLISTAVEHHLGHCQTDLYGQNILNITHPDDHEILKTQLIPKDLDTLFDIQPEDENGEPRERTKEEEDLIDKKLLEDRRNFTVRLARAGPRSEPTCYELVKIDGCFRRADSAPRGVKTSTFPAGLQLIRRARGRDDSIPLHSINGNDIILVAVVRVIRPAKVSNRLLEANYFEYKTRHLIDGRIIDCDQRISLVAGYMTEEVHNLSPFTFMHQDDVRWVIVALRQMYDHRSCYGESCYRLVARNGHFVYLRTRGYLEIDKNTNEVHSFVCINTMVSESEGRRRIQEMKNKFSIIINAKIPTSNVDAVASENPQQLEKAVMCLIQNLDNVATEDDDAEASTSNGTRQTLQITEEVDCNDVKAAIRQTKTPPLALIPPETSSVRSSISKSVSVVNVTVVKSIRNAMSPPVKSPSVDNENSNDSTLTMSSESSTLPQPQSQQIRPSVLQRTTEHVHESSASATVLMHGSQLSCPAGVDHRVPPLPNSSCGCYYNAQSAESCSLHAGQARQQRQQTVLKRTHSSSVGEEEHGAERAKRRMLSADIVAKDPYDAIERSLSEMEGEPPSLLLEGDPCADFSDDDDKLQLTNFIDEPGDPPEMLLDIKREFDPDAPSQMDESFAAPYLDFKPR